MLLSYVHTCPPRPIPHTHQHQAKDHFNKGVVFYLRDGKVVGMMLWNLFDKIPTARKILKENKGVGDIKQLAKLLSVHE